MKKNFLAIFALSFALVLSVTVFAACNGNKDDTSGSQNAGGATSSSQQEAAVTSEVGLTYSHTKTDIKWVSDEAKKTMLDEMECTEKQFFDVYDQTTLEVKFLAGNEASFTYKMGGKGESISLFYKKDGDKITFYDTREDFEKDNAKTDKGVFAGRFELSSDYKTLYWIAEVDGACEITLDCTAKK